MHTIILSDTLTVKTVIPKETIYEIKSHFTCVFVYSIPCISSA